MLSYYQQYSHYELTQTIVNNVQWDALAKTVHQHGADRNIESCLCEIQRFSKYQRFMKHNCGSTKVLYQNIHHIENLCQISIIFCD